MIYISRLIPGTPIETRALCGLSLQIPTGQFVTVIGTNGAGKSTFLNAVSGDLAIDSGSVLIDDIDVTEQPVCGSRKQSSAGLSRPYGRHLRRPHH